MDKYTKEIEVAMRAKTGIVWAISKEETRIERQMVPVADRLGYNLYTWSATEGISEIGGDVVSRSSTQIDNALQDLLKISGRVILIARDAGPWLSDPLTLRVARDTHARLQSLDKENSKQILVVDPSPAPESMSWVTSIDCPLPDRDEMGSIVDSFLEWAPDSAVEDVKKNGNRDALVGAMLGLTSDDASNALSRSLAATGRFDPVLIAKEKARVVKGSGLEWYDPDERGMNAVGGMDELKTWLSRRQRAFGQAARDYGLPSPKGILLVGVPGCGKSLTAKCVANAWGIPLLRMDVGALFSKYVGESEGKIREALRTAETIAPCVLWVDEIEKAFGSGGDADGGTSSRVFGTFLTWMQERKDGVFIIATSNDISKLPPEFCRAGRWDELWFVDLPNATERKEISWVMSKKFDACVEVDGSILSEKTDGYTGSEIEQGFVDAMYAAFDDDRQVCTEDVVEALKKRVPLSKTMSEKIDELRRWALGRARTASSTQEATSSAGRAIE